MPRRVYDDDDRLDIRPYAPVIRPVPIPAADTSAEPLRCLALNAEWWTRLIGVLHALEQPDAWQGTEQERYGAVQDVKELLARIQPCATEEPPMQIFGPMAEWRYMVPDNSTPLSVPTSVILWMLGGTYPTGGPGQWILSHIDDSFDIISGTHLPAGKYRFYARASIRNSYTASVTYRLEVSNVGLPAPKGEPVTASPGEVVDVELNTVAELSAGVQPFIRLVATQNASFGATVSGTATHPWMTIQIWKLSEIVGPPGPPGPRGIPGPTGPQGPPGEDADLSALQLSWSGVTWSPWPSPILRYGTAEQYSEITFPADTPGAIFILRTDPEDPQNVQATWDIPGGENLWFDTGLRLPDPPTIGWSTTMDPYPRALLQYGPPGAQETYPFPFQTPGPDFRLRAEGTGEIMGAWQTGAIPSQWHDTGLRACDVVMACQVGPEQTVPVQTPDPELCAKAYRMVEYVQIAVMDQFFGNIDIVNTRAQNAAVALSAFSTFIAVSWQAGVLLMLGGALTEVIDDELTQIDYILSDTWWQGLSEAVYCDMVNILTSRDYTGADLKAAIESYVEASSISGPLKAVVNILVDVMPAQRIDEWSRLSTLAPPVGACSECPNVYEWDFRQGLGEWHIGADYWGQLADDGIRSVELGYDQASRNLEIYIYGTSLAPVRILKIEALVYRAPLGIDPDCGGVGCPNIGIDDENWWETGLFQLEGWNEYVITQNLPYQPVGYPFNIEVNIRGHYPTLADAQTNYEAIAWIRITTDGGPVTWS